MYLKKIEIQGFKTFADRTVVEFLPGANITAVVGPNGCGKSNFLEAVRWGMGEQSVKSLRSSSAAEIIFSGNKDRRPVSMAEVEITIDNSSKVLDVDYTEVTIKRKLYRSGESEYYLNKSQCRLKDIHDLFMDTGVGKNSYSIIGQGQIDILINMKPEEKKMMFEEAAGINKYKHRKRQTFRKLETTAQNLNRITDLKTEVSGQLTVLEQQAREADIYLKLKDELKTKELSLFKSKVLILQKQKAEATRKANQLKEEILQITEQTNSNDSLKQQHRRQITDLEKDIAVLQFDREKTNKEIEIINTALLVSAERTQNQQQRLEQLAGELGSMDATFKMMKTQKAETSAELQKNKEELKQISKEISEREKELSKSKSKLASLQMDRAENMEKLNADKSRLNVLEDMQRNYDGYFQGVRAILEARDDSNKFSGIKGVVADLINTDKKLELALETALGTHLQDVVTDSDQTAKKAILHLRENGLGRATFLPMNLIRPERISDRSRPFTTDNGIIGIASELVIFQPEYQQIVEHLLGKVLISENMDAALEFVKTERHSGFSRIVTVNGEVVMLSGAMTGGSTAKKTVPLLGRQRLMMDLKKSIEIAALAVERLAAETQSLTAGNERDNDDLIRAKIEVGKLSEYISQAQLKLDAISAAAADAQKQIDNKISEQTEVKTKLIDTEQNIAAQEKRLPELGKKVEKLLAKEHSQVKEKQKLQQEIEEIENSARSILDSDHSLREKLSHFEVQLARTGSDLDMIAERLNMEYDSTLEEVIRIEHTAAGPDQEEQTEKLKRRIKRMEPVNLLAIDEYQKQQERQSFIQEQYQDLLDAQENLNKLIVELDNLARKEFLETLDKIQLNFQETFSRLFEGGKAEIKILDSKNILESGVDIFVQQPRKKAQSMSLMSGGEKALTAVALIFALLQTRPTPFCFLDEVDAALDESNIRRFSEMLSGFSLDSQMIIITHNKQTLTAADAIYGVTMQDPGVSKVISVKMK
ncbi:AAA family ATPase [Candidatus Margulisiibacteriota bacterium]